MNEQEWKTLCDSAPVLLDGAWGSQMQALGLPPGHAPEAWNLTHPEKVQAIGAEYVRSGSRVILTNTFGANRVMLKRHGLERQAAEINRIGAEISCRAAGSAGEAGICVFGSIGPSGKLLMQGDITEEELSDAFEEQAQALRGGGAQALVVETMSDLDEARIAVEAAVATGLPVVGCMVYDSGAGGNHTMMGVTPGEAAAVLEDAGVRAVGANCGKGPDEFFSLMEAYIKSTSLPLWMKPNAGLPVYEEGRTLYTMTPEAFAGSANRLLDAGVTFIGGCCGTHPGFISALRHRLKEKRP